EPEILTRLLHGIRGLSAPAVLRERTHSDVEGGDAHAEMVENRRTHGGTHRRVDRRWNDGRSRADERHFGFLLEQLGFRLRVELDVDRVRGHNAASAGYW